MLISEEDRKRIEAFLTYIEDFNAADERYGQPSRHNKTDGSIFLTRFEAGPAAWLEVAVRPTIPQVRVAFLTDNAAKNEEVTEALETAEESLEELLEIGMEEAGLRWGKPPVEHYRDDEDCFYYATPLNIEDLYDLDDEVIRGKTCRMLEGHLITFGLALMMEPDEDEE